MNDQNPSAPLEILRDGALKITIWKNQSEKGAYPTAVPSKTYEKDGELRDGNTYIGTDLLRLSELARQAYGRLRELRAEFAKQTKQSTTAQKRPDLDLSAKCE